MYVHVGGEYSISDRFIIGIFDLDSISPKQKDTLHFLSEAEKDGKVEYISDDIPRSVILTLDRVYISPISVTTIRKRISDGPRGDE
jgi:extracellular matrix regulatory protein B